MNTRTPDLVALGLFWLAYPKEADPMPDLKFDLTIEQKFAIRKAEDTIKLLPRDALEKLFIDQMKVSEMRHFALTAMLRDSLGGD